MCSVFREEKHVALARRTHSPRQSACHKIKFHGSFLKVVELVAVALPLVPCQNCCCFPSGGDGHSLFQRSADGCSNPRESHMTNLHTADSGQAPSNGVKKARIDGIGQWMCTIHTIIL